MEKKNKTDFTVATLKEDYKGKNFNLKKGQKVFVTQKSKHSNSTFVKLKQDDTKEYPVGDSFLEYSKEQTDKDIFRTGGVAGSKHVDVTKGQRLVHGYKAVKGSDKDTNYSKGKKGVRVDKGWRLPHGYETTEGAKNVKYKTGGNIDEYKNDVANEFVKEQDMEMNDAMQLVGAYPKIVSACFDKKRTSNDCGGFIYYADLAINDGANENTIINKTIKKINSNQEPSGKGIVEEYKAGGNTGKKYNSNNRHYWITYKIDKDYEKTKNEINKLSKKYNGYMRVDEEPLLTIKYISKSVKTANGPFENMFNVRYKAIPEILKKFSHVKVKEIYEMNDDSLEQKKYPVPRKFETGGEFGEKTYNTGGNLEDKLQTDLAKKIYDNIYDFIDDANENTELPGYGIVLSNASININETMRDEFWEDIDLIQSECDCYFEISDYDDLVIKTDQYQGEFRTGGVAGSKHVNLSKGYRLVHGYKAVKGSDKDYNYAKGVDKLKVDKGWRLPHGYEVVEGAYDMKYSRGGLFGNNALVTNIDDEIATDELKSELKSKMKSDDVVIAFAYTDYGGNFFDKVFIEYFEENYPDNIVVENTGWGGKNAFVFGTPAQEFVEETENYPLGFEDTESYYYERQAEEEQEGFDRFIEDDLRDYDFDTEEVLQELSEKFGGYWNVLTTGLDYDYRRMIDHLQQKGLIKEKAAKGKNVTKETLLDKIKSAGAISENQVNLIKNRMNRGAVDSETQEVIDYIYDEEVKLTPEQNEKGIKFLRNLYKSPTGKVRTNNPFGNREISALDTFTHFLIVDFQNIGNYTDNYVPVYAVIGKEGTFEYYYDGKVNIIGAKGMSMYRNGGSITPQDRLSDLVQDMTGDQYEALCYEYDIDFDDANEMSNFIYELNNAQAKELIKKIKSGYFGEDEYRTGGVAGSKHVDLVKGYRLTHGYKAVRGADKNYNYAKGVDKLKVDKGWRLPHGYEVEEGAYNIKYARGANVPKLKKINRDSFEYDGHTISISKRGKDEYTFLIDGRFWSSVYDNRDQALDDAIEHIKEGNVYRTGGVAGSKHVTLPKGYRLVHGYKAVKGTDRDYNYSKGRDKVKVDKGWRLPHGYEVVEGAYNMKYMSGGNVKPSLEEIYNALKNSPNFQSVELVDSKYSSTGKEINILSKLYAHADNELHQGQLDEYSIWYDEGDLVLTYDVNGYDMYPKTIQEVLDLTRAFEIHEFDMDFEEYLQRDDSNFYQLYKNNKFSVFTDKSGQVVEVTIDEAIRLLLNMSVGDIATLSSSTTVERISETKYEINTGGDKGGSSVMDPNYYISYAENPKNDLYFVVLNAFKEEVIDNQIMPEKNNSSSSNITEEQYQRAVNHFVYFCMNYPSNFMDAFTGSMKSHLQSKYNSIYDKVGSKAAMITFYTELDSENQKALLSWAMNNYKGTKLAEGGMMDTEMLSSFDIMKKGKNVETKGSYTILKGNRAFCGVHDKTYSEAMSTAKSHNCDNGLIVKGEMIWTNGRVKGIRFADGEEMIYGDYEREYFTEPQMTELKKLSKRK